MQAEPKGLTWHMSACDIRQSPSRELGFHEGTSKFHTMGLGSYTRQGKNSSGVGIMGSMQAVSKTDRASHWAGWLGIESSHLLAAPSAAGQKISDSLVVGFQLVASSRGATLA